MKRREFLSALAAGSVAAPNLAVLAVVAPPGLAGAGAAAGRLGVTQGDWIAGELTTLRPVPGLGVSEGDVPGRGSPLWWDAAPGDPRLWIDTLKSPAPWAKAWMARRQPARGRGAA